MEKPNLEELQKVHGKVFEAVLPSKEIVVIREQNGEDDDVLSNLADFKQSESINNFLSGVIVYHSKYGVIITPEMIKKMPLRDKYISLILSRVFSFGDSLNFSWEWEDSKKADEYSEDLNIYAWPYDKEFPTEGSEDYHKFRIEPYSTDPYGKIEVLTKSGKSLRLNFLTGEAEIYLLNLHESDKSRNQEYRARGMEIQLENGWQEVVNFKSFSPRDMQDLRKAIKAVDTPIAITTEIENPRTGETIELDLTALEDFFFPSDF